MTEHEWLTSTDPAEMLRMLETQSFPQPSGIFLLISDRKMKLFDHACIEHLDCNSVALRHATGPALGSAANLLRDIIGNHFYPVTLPYSKVKCHICDGFGGELVATYKPSAVQEHCGRLTQERRDVGNIRNGHAPRWCSVCLATFLPEYTGQRIDKPCTCCKGDRMVPGSCPWFTPDAVAIAQAAYDGRDWDSLPVLADVLEEAGCVGEKCPECNGAGGFRDFGWNGSEHYDCCQCGGTGRVAHPLLVHLRGPGPHVRGCWAIDTILGRS